ncbi:MAG TPA: DUF1707 domain-containing protein [Acidimicrobiales bacterium]
MAATPEHVRQAAAAVRDADRDRLVARLRTECTEGRITLDQFSDLVGEVFAADTREELDRVVAVIPPVPLAPAAALADPVAPAATPSAAARAARAIRARRWMVAVFGEVSNRGRYKLDEPSAAVAVFGECTVDLSDATIDGEEAVIHAVAVFGDVTVIVPEGIDVVLEGLAFFGTRRCDVTAQPLPGSPVVVVRAFACFGDVRVRSPRTRSGGRS